MTMNWKQVAEADHEPLRALIDELKSIGWPSVQWGDRGLVLSPKGSYQTAFFEAFGEQEGFIRGEGASVLIAAQKALGKIKRQAACTHPDDSWKYTHTNGFKTCGKCGYFAPCTVQEAMEHYDHGEVKDLDKPTYYSFDFRRPLCPTCGGHILAHDYSFDVDRCTCGQLMEIVEDEHGHPRHDDQHNLMRRPIDKLPEVVGFWCESQQLWLGEDGHAKTYRLSEIRGWRRRSVAGELQDPNLQLRIMNPDFSPGAPVPFEFDRAKEDKQFAESLKAVCEAIAAGDDENGGDESG